MKKITTFIFLMVMISCNKNQSYTDNEQIRKKETRIIIQTLINSTAETTLPICTSLKKLTIKTDLKEQNKIKDSVSIIKLAPIGNILSQNNEIFIEKLLVVKSVFNQKDSLNFVSQNFCLSNLYIPKSISKSAKTISLEELKSQKINAQYMIISIPIFSSDNKKAYVEIDYYSKNRNFGMSFFLQKIGEKWKVVYSRGNWSAC
ncbi:hypothetical protein [Flavobacterium sp.]|jgi:hypothetical protein|uniref:hypothetical protein n=1 Tax=Flavobacterium sp. TaxID=239 RepID=UPI0022C69A4C|nr:hypothetical protein [Flavobacterium sp.]MCZ8228354.1 hypothetical protein [Flavobacterium sp.]